MAIGCWGTALIFSTSDRRVLTFNDLNHTVGSEWATHSSIGQKDRKEYLRPKLQKLTFTIDLDATLGVKPRATLDMIASHAENGSVFPMVVGGRRIGSYRWCLVDASEAWEVVMDRGELVRAKVNLTMEEYV